MMKMLGVVVPEEMIKRIDEIARKEKNPRSAVVRRLLSEALEKINKIESGGG